MRKGIPDEVRERIDVIRVMMLMALNVTLRHQMYQGTVSAQTKAKRRSLNKRQKASRKANR